MFNLKNSKNFFSDSSNLSKVLFDKKEKNDSGNESDPKEKSRGKHQKSFIFKSNA